MALAGDGVSDGELVARVTRRDERALAALYDRHAARVYGLALRVTGDAREAEEVVQDVFLRLWRHAPRYDRRLASPRSWLLIMARHCSIDRLRARGRRPQTITLSEQVGSTPGGMVQAEDNITLGHIRDAAAALPDGLREVLELAYFNGWTQREIAGHLDLPLGTVKTRLRQAVARLRDLLFHEGALDP